MWMSERYQFLQHTTDNIISVIPNRTHSQLGARLLHPVYTVLPMHVLYEIVCVSVCNQLFNKRRLCSTRARLDILVLYSPAVGTGSGPFEPWLAARSAARARTQYTTALCVI